MSGPSDNNTRVLCCNKDGSVDAQTCGSFWGEGSPCDSVMQNFCENDSTNNKWCNCLNSKLPLAKCTDYKCSQAGYKTESLKSQSCDGINIQVCQSILDIGNNADNNAIINNNIKTYCQSQVSTGEGGSSGGGKRFYILYFSKSKQL